MLKRIAAIVFIFLATTLAWMILGGTILARTNGLTPDLRRRVSSTWGTSQAQLPPTAWYSTEVEDTNTREVDGRKIVENVKRSVRHDLPLQSSAIKVNLNLEHRQKGLLWYATYKVDFTGDYTFRNGSDAEQLVYLHFPYPAAKAIYDDFRILANGQPLALDNSADNAQVSLRVPPHQTVVYTIGYKSQGLDNWNYRFGSEVNQVRNFSLQMQTNFQEIDFPDNTLSPTDKQPSGDGWLLTWKYSSLLSGFDIGMVMPEKLQPGPLAGQISFFAPVSLFFFFFLMLIITTLREIDLHPMNYFFLATAFFAFHLLLAYLVDHISIHLAFVICSAVSIFLVVSYLRLVVGPKFAFVEAGLAQFIYLVMFSYAFFFKGFTGLAVTIGAIVTLFVVMQMTAKIKWSEKFAAMKPNVPPRQNPLNGESWVRG
jgi:inner membrane protein involved in colicin E2 resistance